MTNVAVIGSQWGDEGKGKVVDLYSAKADFIARYQGGNNAGHTLVVNGKKTVLHLIPSGVLHKGKTCLIANGVVFDPLCFFEEIDQLIAANVLGHAPWNSVKVSERAHVILPYHCQIDKLRENHLAHSDSKIGTTHRGIGPAYEDKVSRRGIQVIDLLDAKVLRRKLQLAIEEKNVLLKNLYSAPAIELEPLLAECLKLGERLRPYVNNVRSILVQATVDKKPILFEGAQGTLLDIDHGTYPYVTSSNTTAAGAFSGTGLGLGSPTRVIGITKAYVTRVGSGPFPSEIEKSEPQMAEQIRKIGMEFGATTGRPRRVGWLDLVALKYAVEVNGLDGLALMKADVLSGLSEIRVCTGYKIKNAVIHDFMTASYDLDQVKPIFESLPGWTDLNDGVTGNFLKFIRFIEAYVKTKVILVSTGPGREQTLELENPFQNLVN